MTRTGKSIFYFGFWVLCCGISLMFFPKFCLDMVDMQLPNYLIPRVFGMVLIYLAIYYFFTGLRSEFWPFFRITIFTRSSAMLISIIFVILGIAKPIIIAFVTVDVIGAIWTAIALKMDMKDGVCT